MKPVEAESGGHYCALCACPIFPGDEIVPLGKGWVHADCAEDDDEFEGTIERG